MNSQKCARCGLVNFASVEECRRCGNALSDARVPTEIPSGSRLLFKRALVVLGVASLFLGLFYVSLLESSQPVSFEQRENIDRAIDIIELKGFARDAFLLRRLASFRTTDNWWNQYVGHADAYAASNFPFQVVTLYPEFFKSPADDIERAAVLLHEARHLSGADEESAFSSVWRDKERLGWTIDKYGATKVWKSTVELTSRYAPQLFSCGDDGRSDCAETKETLQAVR